MPRYKDDRIEFWDNDEILNYALYGLYLQENYARMEDYGWAPPSPDEFFGAFADDGAAELTQLRNERMWQTVGLRLMDHTCAYELPDITVGPAETQAQAECLLALHETFAYLETGRLVYTGLVRVSDMPPAPLAKEPEYNRLFMVCPDCRYYKGEVDNDTPDSRWNEDAAQEFFQKYPDLEEVESKHSEFSYDACESCGNKAGGERHCYGEPVE